MDNRHAFLDAERNKWLTVQEAAFILRASHTTVRRMLVSGTLPHRR